MGVTLVFDDGTTAVRTFAIGGSTRVTIPVGAEFPEAAGRRFGALVESVGNAPVPIVVERAMYSDAEGMLWAAGSNLVATRLQGNAEAMGVVVGPTIGPAVDESRAATAAVTATAGGTATTTSATGVTYALSIPAGAIVDDVTVSLAPLAGVAGLPAGSQVLAGVQFGPDGLQLYKPATLTISLPPGVDASRVIGLSYSGHGMNILPELVAVRGQTLTYRVTHFSGFFAAVRNSIPESFFDELLSEELPFRNRFLSSGHVATTDEAIVIHREWYQALVAPRLRGAGASDDQLNEALAAYMEWRDGVENSGEALGLDQARILRALAPELRQAANLAAAALQPAMQRANLRCVRQHSQAEANAALRWQAIAEALEIATPGSALALDTLLDQFCVEMLYENTSFPPAPAAGQQRDARASGGIRVRRRWRHPAPASARDGRWRAWHRARRHPQGGPHRCAGRLHRVARDRCRRAQRRCRAAHRHLPGRALVVVAPPQGVSARVRHSRPAGRTGERQRRCGRYAAVRRHVLRPARATGDLERDREWQPDLTNGPLHGRQHERHVHRQGDEHREPVGVGDGDRHGHRWRWRGRRGRGRCRERPPDDLRVRDGQIPASCRWPLRTIRSTATCS